MGKKPSAFAAAAAAAASETAVEHKTQTGPFPDRMTALHDTGSRVSARLRRVAPEECRLWEHHNRDYQRLTEENCRDLIDSIISQGEQEQPAIVRSPSAFRHLLVACE